MVGPSEARDARAGARSPLPAPGLDEPERRSWALTQTPVPEQVSFRLDFPAWRSSRCERDRRVIDELMAGERALDVAARHGLTPGRVSQLRREFHDDWTRFCGECLAGEVGADDAVGQDATLCRVIGGLP